MAWKDRLGNLELRIFDRDHPPPHIHVLGPDMRARIAIESGKMLDGHLPARLRRNVELYVNTNKEALLEAWRVVEAEQGRPDRGTRDPRTEGDGREV